jgi:2-polyprenyl-3-methyl-5-hydroxy-6-metoxy-1,4-benzoquinol methylase
VRPAPERCPACDEAPRASGLGRGGITFVRCPRCRSLWQRPFPSAARLAEIYGAGYLQRWGIDGPDASARLAEVRAMKAATYAAFLARVARHRRDGRLLDVGCALGFLLGEARRVGYEPYGVDLNASAIARARAEFGERVQAVELAAAFPGVAFDVVTLIDVLEHVPAPGELLATIATRLAPGGVLALVLPNAASLCARLLGNAWPHLAEEHLFLWTPGGLERFLARHGWRVRETRTGIAKTFTGRYLAAYRRALGQWAPPGLAHLGRLRAFTGEMSVVAERSLSALG